MPRVDFPWGFTTVASLYIKMESAIKDVALDGREPNMKSPIRQPTTAIPWYTECHKTLNNMHYRFEN